MTQLTGKGGPGRGQGRKPKPENEKYQQYPLKLPPAVIDWLAENVDNKNGFIVQAIKNKIETVHNKRLNESRNASDDLANRIINRDIDKIFNIGK